jgi:hypothetical protein
MSITPANGRTARAGIVVVDVEEIFGAVADAARFDDRVLTTIAATTTMTNATAATTRDRTAPMCRR